MQAELVDTVGELPGGAGEIVRQRSDLSGAFPGQLWCPVGQGTKQAHQVFVPIHLIGSWPPLHGQRDIPRGVGGQIAGQNREPDEGRALCGPGFGLAALGREAQQPDLGWKIPPRGADARNTDSSSRE